MTEQLDIVDSHDRVIGQAERRYIHEKQLMHRSTHILLLNACGGVFVQLRAMTKDTNPGLWDTSAAGHVDAGESYLYCAQRELQEELGIVLEQGAFSEIGRLSPEAANGFEFVRIYSVVSDAKITLEQAEITDGKWLSLDDLRGVIASNSDDYTDTFKVIATLYINSIVR